MTRATRVEVDLNAIAHNIRSIRRLIGEGRRLMAVVKADGYGHGAYPVARTALQSGAEYLAVALPEEGVILREAGIEVPILVLGLISPKEAPLVVNHDLSQTLCTLRVAEALNKEAQSRGKRVPVHLKVDTGMGRIGVLPGKAPSVIKGILSMSNLYLEGIYSHFPVADLEDKDFTLEQIRSFQELCTILKSSGIRVPLKHLANSAAILDLPSSYMDMVRPGIAIYGLYPSIHVQRPVHLKPAMTLMSAISLIKEIPPGSSISYGRTFIAEKTMRVATLPIGYADGYSRLLSNSGEVLIRGKRSKVLGIVCMDMFVVNVTHIPEATVGDEVVLFGQQEDQSISVEEVAEKMGTINYEVLCNISKRVPRIYK